jgi:hypothetical protein
VTTAMSVVHLEPRPNEHLIQALGHYQSGEFSLTVGPSGIVPANCHRISIDTLTLYFAPKNLLLVGLDAYVNLGRAEHRPLRMPPVDITAALASSDLFDEHGIGPGSDIPPRYALSENTRVLCINLGDSAPVICVRGLSCLVCSLGTGGELIEIWIEGLVMA